MTNRRAHELSEWPYPIAYTYTQTIEEKDPRLAVRYLIKTYAATLKYIAILAVADYLNLESCDAGIDRLIGKELERPSLGHWRGWVRAFSRWWQNNDVSFILDPLFKLTKPERKRVERLLDEFVAFRNEHVHPDWFPPEAESRKVFEKWNKRYVEFLSLLGFLTESRLLKQEDNDTFSICHGPEISRFASYTSDHVLNDTSKSLLFVEKTDNSLLPLPVLLYWKMSEVPEGVYIYETLMGKRASYFNANRRGVFTGSIVDDIKALVAELKLGCGDSPTSSSPPLEQLSIAVLKEKAYNNYETSKHSFSSKFKPKLYVGRESADTLLNQFLTPHTPPVAVLLSKSGAGKTNTLCKLAHSSFLSLRLNRADTDANDPIVFLFNARFMVEDNIDRFLGEKLGMTGSFAANMPSLRHQFKNTGERLLVIIDGLNEHRSPGNLWEQILIFANQIKNDSWLKILVSSRPMAWEELSRTMPEADKTLLFRPEGELVISLGDFTENEFGSAFAKYADHFRVTSSMEEFSREVIQWLHDPLIMRFAFEAFQGSDRMETDGRLSLDAMQSARKIIKIYLAKKIREDRDHDFIMYLIRAMWLLGKDELDHGDLGDQRLNVPAKAEYGPEPTLGAQLAEYVYMAPVYDVNIVYFCRNRHCDSYGEPQAAPEDENHRINEFCNACEDFTLFPEVVNESDFRSAYGRCIDEGIISETADSQGDLNIRFVYDRILEYLLSRWLEKEAVEGSEKIPVKDFYTSAIHKGAGCSTFWSSVKDSLVEQISADEPIVDLGDFEPEKDGLVWSMMVQVFIKAKTIGRIQDFSLLRALIDSAGGTRQMSWKRVLIRAGAFAGSEEILFNGITDPDELVQNEAKIALITLWRFYPDKACTVLHQLITSISLFRPKHLKRAFSGISAGLIMLACEANMISDKKKGDKCLGALGKEFKYFLRKALMLKNGKATLKTKALIKVLRSQVIQVLVSSRNSHDQDYLGEYKAIFKRMGSREREMMCRLMQLFHRVETPMQFIDDLVHCATQDYMIPATIYISAQVIRNPGETYELAEEYFSRILSVVPMNPEVHSQIGWGYYMAFSCWQKHINDGGDREHFDSYFKLYEKSLRTYLIRNQCRIRSGVKEGSPGDKKSKGGGWFVVIHCVLYLQARVGKLEDCRLLDEYCCLLDSDPHFALDHVECMHRALALGGYPEHLSMLAVVLEKVGLEKLVSRVDQKSRTYRRFLEYLSRIQRLDAEIMDDFLQNAVLKKWLPMEIISQVQAVETPEQISDMVSQRSNRFFVSLLGKEGSFLQEYIENIMEELVQQKTFGQAVEFILLKLIEKIETD